MRNGTEAGIADEVVLAAVGGRRAVLPEPFVDGGLLLLVALDLWGVDGLRVRAVVVMVRSTAASWSVRRMFFEAKATAKAK